MAIDIQVLADIALKCDEYRAVASLTQHGIRIATIAGDRWIVDYQELEMLVSPVSVVEQFLDRKRCKV